MQRIFVVEDDDSIREMLMYALGTAGFDVQGFSDGGELLPALAQRLPALILLDIMLPGEDGISLLQKLRQSGPCRDVPVIMLTAKGGELDRIRGLDLGADDYVTKPFSILEVISRVKAVLRRGAAAPDSAELAVGDIVLDGDRHTVFAGGEPVSLTFREFALLAHLMRNAGIVLSRDRLLEQVWGYDYSGESRTVDMHIKSLRKKLGDAGAAIVTVRNVGYKIGG
ncbi:MAG: response regulator transcription factor [Clostridiales bacterium]|nr:response regulator transcription factor [Clostridiales bacterium]